MGEVPPWWVCGRLGQRFGAGIVSRELALIGIGAGDPDWVTVEAARLITSLDVLFVVRKEESLDDLVEARRAVIARHRQTPLRTVELRDPPRPWRSASDYDVAVAEWRAERLVQWGAAIDAHLDDGQCGGFLVWGDPGLYDSTVTIARELADEAADSESPIRLRVIPGISSVSALTARHGIPLNRQGRSVEITPARLVRDGLPDGVDDVVVMLDAHQTFTEIDPAGVDIYWGAYLGTDDEILIRGPLAQVRDDIVRARAEAVARKGWVFDTYLLRRR